MHKLEVIDANGYIVFWTTQFVVSEPLFKMTSPNYNAVKYTTEIEVAKSADAVFNHLLHDVAKFWPEDFEGESSKLNDEFLFTTGGGSHYSKNKVVELAHNEKWFGW